MCGRAAVIRGGAGLARVAGARRVIRPVRRAHAGPAPRGGGGGGRGGASDASSRPLSSDESATDKGTKQAAPTPDVATVATSRGKGKDSAESESSTSVEVEKSDYINYNAGPTSWIPVWRIQGVEEQHELLQLESSGGLSEKAKTEVEEVAGDIKVEDEKELKPMPVIHYMQWGFPNPFAGRSTGGGPPGKSHVFNARSETIDEKNMFKNLVTSKRCVAIVDSFYEWHTEYSAQTGDPAKKQGYVFHMPLAGSKPPTINIKKSNFGPGESPFPPMYLAALYDASVNDTTGEVQYCCVILTTGPSAEMRKVHTRMPCVLTLDDAKKWVDCEKNPWSTVKPLLKPYEGLGYYPVPPAVNNGRNKTIECIEPLSEWEKRQKAGSITRFFAPAKTNKSPVAKSSASGGASVKSESSTSPFFNPAGEPGRAFVPTVNPADPGQMEGKVKSEGIPPKSDAADAVEEYVREQKRAETKAAVKEEKEESEHGNKRKLQQLHPPNDEFDSDSPTVPFEPLEEERSFSYAHSIKKAKTSHDKAQQA